MPRKTPYIILIITDNPKEFYDMPIRANVHMHAFPKEDLNKVIEFVFEPELENVGKVIYLEDASSLSDKNGLQMTKLFSESRHYTCDVIINTHFLSATDIRLK